MSNIRRRAGEECGLTLLELMAALVILGLVITLSRPILNGINSRWRLRSAAYQVESVVRFAQNAAAARDESVQVLYDVTEGSHWVRIGDTTYSFRTLPDGVRFESVNFGERPVVRDVAACGVFSDGTLDGHSVTLHGAGDTRIRLDFDRLTGEAYYEEVEDGAF